MQPTTGSAVERPFGFHLLVKNEEWDYHTSGSGFGEGRIVVPAKAGSLELLTAGKRKNISIWSAVEVIHWAPTAVYLLHDGCLKSRDLPNSPV
jgi:hypothetical protein